MNKIIVSICLCLLLVGCGTPYARQSWWHTSNYGYDDFALAPNVYLVNYRGNSQVDTTQNIFKRLLYRASEVAKENGASHFSIEDFFTNSELREGTLPGWSSSQSSGSVLVNPYAGSGSLSSQTSGFYIPPQTVRSHDISMQVVIKLIPAPTDKTNLIDADFILANWDVKNRM